MKKSARLYPVFFLTLFTFILLTSCNNQPPNGWYLMDDSGKNISVGPILDVQDFAEISLDSSTYYNGEMIYVLLGVIKPEKQEVFADATEKAIGKHLGFLFEGEILTNPVVNMRIEGGRFLITSPEFTNRERAMEVCNKLKEEMQN